MFLKEAGTWALIHTYREEKLAVQMAIGLLSCNHERQGVKCQLSRHLFGLLHTTLPCQEANQAHLTACLISVLFSTDNLICLILNLVWPQSPPHPHPQTSEHFELVQNSLGPYTRVLNGTTGQAQLCVSMCMNCSLVC